MTIRILLGDCRDLLKNLPDQSVHCCITSPPYWGLRDYGHPNQIGLEFTPEEYVANIVEVFREVRRILRKDGTCWVVLGDSYAGYHGNSKVADADAPSNKPGYVENMRTTTVGISGLKHKDLVGIPWRVAFALQADGWWLRQDIIWAKPNPMPESVTDRCTKSHEYVFLLAKAERYWYDAEAVKDDVTAHPKPCGPKNDASRNDSDRTGIVRGNGLTRNRRSVWTVATQPYSGSHFATFPPALIEPMILAGCPAQTCPTCGKGWERVVEKGESSWEARKAAGHKTSGYHAADGAIASFDTPKPREGKRNECGLGWVAQSRTLGHRPACTCPPADPIPGTVLDPFGGSGTTGQVAERLGRNAILIELNPDYLLLADRRTAQGGLALGAA